MWSGFSCKGHSPIKAHKVIKHSTHPKWRSEYRRQVRSPSLPNLQPPSYQRGGQNTPLDEKSSLPRCRWRRRMGTQSTNALWCHSSMLSCLAWIIWGGRWSLVSLNWRGKFCQYQKVSPFWAEGQQSSLFVADFVSKRKKHCNRVQP